jgi:hypothetical protein
LLLLSRFYKYELFKKGNYDEFLVVVKNKLALRLEEKVHTSIYSNLRASKSPLKDLENLKQFIELWVLAEFYVNSYGIHRNDMLSYVSNILAQKEFSLYNMTFKDASQSGIGWKPVFCDTRRNPTLK